MKVTDEDKFKNLRFQTVTIELRAYSLEDEH
jgi:hypothetical protein